jgi:hypothetical protein
MDATELPPELQPASAAGSREVQANGNSEVTDLLLRILSKLTVYQSLPESPGLVLAVRDDVSMLDACCLLLPTSSVPIIEVLNTDTDTDSPTSRSTKLLELAASRPEEDFMFARALEHESARVTSAVASDTGIVYPVGDYLSVHDVFFFLKRVIANDPDIGMSVREWISIKRSAATCEDSEDEWIRFCETSTLITRSSINLSQGVGPNQVISGSTMNLSSSHLLTETNKSFGGAKSGGSCLNAVNELLDRPWQSYLPLTVSTEKGISAVFGYTSLKQLMAHVAMNCSDRRLESFFSAPIAYEYLRQDAESNLNACALLDYDEATLEDAIEVLSSGPLSLLVSGEFKTFHRFVTPVDICNVLAEKLDHHGLTGSRLKECLTADEESCISESDFPIALSSLLEKLLMSKADAVAVVSEDEVPIGIVTCRDVWAYVMQGGEQ